jgi:putative DNA methylase
MNPTRRKKLIEVALPLEAINAACIREGAIRQGHPNTLHLWWARRRLAAARAVIFAQMVDDPSASPDLFPSEKSQQKERSRLFRIIEELVLWENINNEKVLQNAREEIWQSWRRACADNADDPRADRLFDRHRLPGFHDPFAGGGAIPLEAERLGLESHASDLNPVAVLINKAMIEIPPKFAGKPPVNLEARSNKSLFSHDWKGAQGLAVDVRHYGRWMRDEAEKRISTLYPKVDVTPSMAKGRADLEPYVGKSLKVIAWLWARTVKSPNPAFAQVDVPLVSSFMLSSKAAKGAFVEPVIENGGYRFTVKTGKPKDVDAVKSGTKLSRGANFQCLMSGTPITGDYIKSEGKAGRISARLMAIVAEGDRGRIYFAPTPQHEAAARNARPEWKPTESLPLEDTGNFWCSLYGLTTYGDLFTPRQLVALTTFADLVAEARDRVRHDAVDARSTSVSQGSLPDDARPLRDGGLGPDAYADGIATYLGCAVSRMVNYSSALCVWSSHPKDELAKQVFLRQALPMTWDYAETNPFSSAGGTLDVNIDYLTKAIERLPGFGTGAASQADATQVDIDNRVVSTDPPYYDNIGYADLSDFFYVWLRRSLRPVFPDLFATLTVPKAEELVATPYRHGGRERAEAFFLEGMTQAMHRISEQAHPAFPVTIYYAFKQSETESDAGTASTGWETFLTAVIIAGFAVTGTWPMRTEMTANLKRNIGALASSIILVCRKRNASAASVTRRDFIAALRAELPEALANLQRGNIAPVDLAQAAIGPGMSVFTRYGKVLDAEGKPLGVREALGLINQTLDEALAEQEGDFDADSRWALAWFEQHGFSEGEFGVADVLARAKNTSVQGLVSAGILKSSRGDVRLLKPAELEVNWDPSTDARLSAWESVHQLIRVLETGGEDAAAQLVAKLGSKAEMARDLCYRLYTLCERKKRAAEALSYNGLVQSFPELERLAKEPARRAPAQASMLAEEE